MWPGLNPEHGTISRSSLLLVLALLQGFFSMFSGFPPSTKINTSKLQFDLETVDEEPLRGMCHCKFLFIHLFIYLFN